VPGTIPAIFSVWESAALPMLFQLSAPMSILKKKINLTTLVESLNNNWESNKTLRLQLSKQTPRYGNDNDAADNMMKRIFNSLYQAIEGKRNNRGGEYHVDMLPTTCHIYFGEKTGATADGRFAGEPLSEGNFARTGGRLERSHGGHKLLRQDGSVKNGRNPAQYEGPSRNAED
jgi:hypothetical protein